MKKIEGNNTLDKNKRQFVDWKKTSKNLALLRQYNENLRKYVCFQLKGKIENCSRRDCENCRFEMDERISQKELAQVFGVSDSVIVNWESGRTNPDIDDLLFYCQICKMNIFDILILEER